MSAGTLLVAGAGIGGLAAALQAARAGWQVRVLERAAAFGEVGAGVQLGPNATRLLHAWGLGAALNEVAALPQRLSVRSATDGAALGTMRLGDAMHQRYGAPYATLHRRDLHALLFRAVQAAGGVDLRLQSNITHITQASGSATSVTVRTEDGGAYDSNALVGADGLWSTVRTQVAGIAPPAPSGHVAYRAMVAQRVLPAALRSHDVSVWLGPRLHAVAYPVRCGEWLNVVVIVADGRPRDAAGWDQQALAADLQQAMGPTTAALQSLVRAIDGWRLWVLHHRPPLHGPDGMARGRIALLGDAAHPMPPYLAQGAGMALEDAAELGHALHQVRFKAGDVPAALGAYGAARWQRNARVQRRAQRNATVFHATGPLRLARDVAMRFAGERLLDQPWLYGHQAGAGKT